MSRAYYHTSEGMRRLSEGLIWENALFPHIQSYIEETDDLSQITGVREVVHTEEMEMQKRGFDYIINPEPTAANLKSRRAQWCTKDENELDLFLEVEDGDDPGWIYNDELCVLVYVWEQEDRRNIQKSVVVWVTDEFQDWLRSRAEMFEKQRSGTSLGRIVQVNEIPDRWIDKDPGIKLGRDLPKPVNEMTRGDLDEFLDRS